MQRHNFSATILLLLITAILCNSCYRHNENEAKYSEEQRDSLTFAKSTIIP